MKNMLLVLMSAVMVGCSNPTIPPEPTLIPGVITNVAGNVITATTPDGNEYACFVDNGKAYWRGMHVMCEFLMPSEDVTSYQLIDLWEEN